MCSMVRRTLWSLVWLAAPVVAQPFEQVESKETPSPAGNPPAVIRLDSKAQLLLRNWAVVKIMGTAVAVGAAGVWVLVDLGLAELHIKVVRVRS